MNLSKLDILIDINNYLNSCGYQQINITHPILSDHFCRKYNSEIQDNIDYHRNLTPGIKLSIIDMYVLPKLGLSRKLIRDIETFDDLSEWFPDEAPNQNGKMRMVLDIGSMFGDNSGKIDIFSN